MQHQADQNGTGAERVGDRGGVHAGEHIGHADEPDGADDHEQAAENDEAAAQPFAREIEAHGSSSPAWPRAPKRRNFSTANVPMMLSIA